MNTHSSEEEPRHQDELHEKKLSVMKRVKAKVKKIRDNIGSKIHGHDHEHDPELDLDDDDEDEEDDFLEALDQDTQVHAEPMHESDEAKIGSKHLNSGTTAFEHGGSGPTRKFEEIGAPGSKWTDSSEKANFSPAGQPVDKKANSENPRTSLDTSTPLEVVPCVHKDRFGTDSSGYYQSKVSDPISEGAKEANVERIVQLFEKMDFTGQLEQKHTSGGSHDQLSPHMSKVTDPTSPGPQEADVQPTVQSFGKMDFLEEAEQKVTFTGTECSKQFTSDSATHPSATYKSVTPNDTESFHDLGLNATEPDNVNVDEETSRNPSYSENFTSATSVVAGSAASTISGTAISAKKIAVAKLGYSGDESNIFTHDTKTTEKECTSIGDQTISSSTPAVGDDGKQIAIPDEMHVDAEPNRNSSCSEKIPFGMSHIAASAATSIIGTADSANDVVSSELGNSGNDDSHIATNDIMSVDNEGMGISEKSKSSTVPVGDYGRQTAKPDDMNIGEEPNRNPSYTEKIKSATSAIAGSAASTITSTAISAKNVFALKVGYSGDDNSSVVTNDIKSVDKEGTSIGEQTNTSTAAVGDYGRQIGKLDDINLDGEPDKNTSCTEQMPSAMSAIAASEASTVTDIVSANDGVASKLGLIGNDNSDIAARDADWTDKEDTSIGEQTELSTATVGDYANQIAKPDHMNVDKEPIRNPSYTEKLKSATSAIAGSAASTITSTAISAKNIVASKLGYSRNDSGKVVAEDTNSIEKEGTNIAEQTKSSNTTERDYGQPIPATEKVVLLSEKDAEDGITALSKKTATEADTGMITNSMMNPGTETGTGGVCFITEKDKGTSVKGYLVENLSPEDEGKPLCEVLSGNMHKTKEEFPEKVAENMDTSTGMFDEGYGNNGSSTGVGTERSTASKGMVDRVKGAVSYFWQKKDTGDQINADKQKVSKGTTTDEQIVSEGSTGEKDENHEATTTGVVQ